MSLITITLGEDIKIRMTVIIRRQADKTFWQREQHNQAWTKLNILGGTRLRKILFTLVH